MTAENSGSTPENKGGLKDMINKVLGQEPEKNGRESPADPPRGQSRDDDWTNFRPATPSR